MLSIIVSLHSTQIPPVLTIYIYIQKYAYINIHKIEIIIFVSLGNNTLLKLQFNVVIQLQSH